METKRIAEYDKLRIKQINETLQKEQNGIPLFDDED